MKKIMLLMAAFIATTMAYAQGNLAINPIGDNVNVTATASICEGDFTADKAIDGNTTTRWGSNATGNTDTEWFQIEWSEAQTFNTIKMLCQDAMNMGAHSYDIKVSNDGESWTTVAEVRDRLTPGGEYETVKLNNGEDVTAKFVKFQGVTKGTYGYTFFEFEVYKLDYSKSVFTSFTASPSFVVAGRETEISIHALDQNSESLSSVTYTVDNGTLDGNMLTATASGYVTITATYGGVEKSVRLYALGDADAPAAPAAEDIVTPVYSNTDTKYNSTVVWTGEWNEKADVSMPELTLGGQVVKPVGAAGCLFIGNTLTVGEDEDKKTIFDGWTINYTPTTEYGTILHVELFTANDATGKFNFEQSGLDDPIIATKGGEWTKFDIDVANATILRTITLKLDKMDGEYPDVLVANVYFTNKAGEDPQPGNSVLTTFTLPKFGALIDGSANVSASLLDDAGAAYTGEVAYTISEGATIEKNEDGSIKITAKEADIYTVTATAAVEDGDDVVLTQDITLINGLPTTPADEAANVYAIYSDTYGATKVDEVLPNGWFTGYQSAEETALSSSDNAWFVTGAGSFALRRGTPTVSEYNSLKLDVYAFEDIIGKVQPRSGRDVNGTEILPEQTIKLKAGQWNHIEVSLTEATKTEIINDTEEVSTTIGYVLLTCQTKGFHNLIIDNVYLSTAEAVVPEIELTTEQTGEAEYKFFGVAKTARELNEAMSDPNATMYDLTELKLAADITTITPTNLNALIVVKSESIDNTTGNYTSAVADQLSGTDNVMVTNGYYFPTKQLKLTDGYPVYTGNMLSTNSRGYKYTRSFDEDKYVTTYLPAGTTLPEGITAYEFGSATDSGSETVYTFKKIESGQLAAKTPYILHVTKGAELSAEGTGNLDMTGDDSSVRLGSTDVTFYGTFNTFAGDGAQYGLSNATESIVLRKVDGATIGAFRGYFTIGGSISDAKVIRFDFTDGGQTNGISNAKAESAKAAAVYSIDGRLINANGSTEGLTKGLYIVGGKKVIVK